MALMKERISLTNQMRQGLDKEFTEAKKNPIFVALMKKLELSENDAKKITSKLQHTIEEMNHCKNCKGLYQCQNDFEGHISFPEKKEGRIYFSFAPCKYQTAMKKAIQEKKAKADPNKMARMKDIDMNGDKKRIAVIRWLDNFCETYDYAKSNKGIFLHGNFGSGKTFLVSALFHELNVTKHASIAIEYFPEILRTLKDDWELYETKMKLYQNVDLLLLDDIGAEKVTEWGRDEVLGTILQYRMTHHLPTFFTSNMTLEELEKHLANTGRKDEVVKARRIIERMRQLATPMELISENRRK